MRKNIDVFKAIRHFGVTAEEIDEMAKAYKFWLSYPTEFVLGYNKVYYHKGVLYALPYPIKALEKAFVGIELNGVIYLAGFQCDVCQERIAEFLMWIKGQVFLNLNNVQYGVEIPNNLKLELPTKDEVVALLKISYGNVNLDNIVSCWKAHYWISPDSEHPLETVLDMDFVPYSPNKDTKAFIQPVIHPRKGIDFIGHLNRFGVPDKVTAEKYRELSEIVKH